MGNDNRKWLYDSLKGKGYNLGSFEDYEKNIGNAESRKWLYDNAIKTGYKVGSFEEFDNAIGANASDGNSSNEIGSVAQQVIGEYDKANLPQSELSPYVRGKGENVEIFGVPFADYKNMPPEEQSRVYSEAIERKKQEERNVFSNYVSSQLGEIDGELNQRQETVAPAAGSAFIPSTAVVAAQRFGNSDNKETQDRYTSLHAAKNLLDDANKLVEEAKKGDTGFFSSLGRGFKDKFVDTDNWTMGLTDTAYSGLLRKAVEKEEHGEELSPEESKLLDAAAVNMATQAYFSSEMSRGYKAGSMTAESIPFMLEFAVNPISSTGNALAKGLLKHGLKRFGSVATSKVAKVAGRLAGDAVAAAGMTATTGLGRVAAGVNERMIGDVQSTVEDGEIKYDGRENGMEVGEAFAKSATSNFLENQSEMVFNAFAGGGKMAKEALGKFVPGFSKLSNSEIAQFIGKIQNNPTVKNIANRTQFHGLLGEYAEEVYNNFANIPLGEMSVEQATDLDQNIDTFLGLAPTSAAFGLLGIGGMGYESYTSKRNLRRFNEGLSEDDKALFDELRQVINTGDKATTKAFVKRTLNDKKLTQEQKKERVFAVQDMEKAKVVEDVQQESSLPVPEEIEANKVDVYRNYKRAERKINSLVPADIIPQLDGVTDVEQFAHDNNLNDNQAMAVSDYLTTQQPYNQYIEQTNQRREEAKVLTREQAVADVEKISNPETGLVSQVKHKFSEAPVYLVGGRLSFGEDGLLDRDNSSETVYYVDGNGERKMANYEDFDGVLNETAVPDMISQTEADAESSFISSEEESLRSPEIPAPTRGETFMMNGSRYLVEGDNADTPGESIMAIKLNEEGEIDIDNGDERPVSLDEYYSLRETELWGEGTQVEQPVEELTEENSEQSVALSENEPLNESIPQSEESKVSEIESLPEKAPAIPSDDKGNLLYHKAPVGATIDSLYREELEPDEMDGFVQANKDASSKLLSSLEGKTPKVGTNIAKYKADKLAWQERLSDAKAQVDYWNSVSEEIAASRVQPGDKTAEAITSMGEPMSGEELAATMLGTGRLPVLYDSYKKETGGRNTEARGMVGLFASKANGGMSIEEAGEQLMLADQENGTNFFDQDDPNAGRNAIIDVLSGARTRGDLFGYIKNNREAMAERERQAEYDAYSSWTEENFGMTPDDYESYEEQAPASVAERFKDFDEEEFYNNIANELNEEQEEIAGATASSEVLQGEGIVSPERTETSDNEGGSVPTSTESGSEEGTLLEETPTELDESFSREQENQIVNENGEVSESIPQEEHGTKSEVNSGDHQEINTFVSPTITPGEDALDYAQRIAHEKEEYDTRLPFGVLPNAQNEEAIPESEMNAQEEAVHIEKGNKVIEDAQQTLNNIVEEREKVNQTPSEAQKEAGNYKKGHLKIDSYNVSIENPKGSERTGIDAGGQSWSVTMNNDYGYIRGTEGVDGDHIDMFLSDFPDQGNVFVVDQVKEDGSFDEHKVMYGFSSVDEARDAYLANYSPGWKGLKNITEVSKEEFKKWIDSSKRKTKAFAEYKIAKDRSGIDFPNSHVGDGGIIINEDGTPMTLYHGTLNENVKNVTDLEPGHRRDDGDKASFNGSGISFTPSESVALDYSGGKSDKVYHGNITLRKPYYSYGVAGLNEVEAEELTEKLKSDGHDGIIVYASPVMRKHGDTPIEVIVFSKDSIIKINDDIRFREEKDDASDFASKHNIDEADVRKYAESMQLGNLGSASSTFHEIRRKKRTENTTDSLRQFSQRFSPIMKELYETFGNVEELRKEAVRATMEERNIMESAHKRIEAEEETKRVRLQEFQDMSIEQLDGEYLKSIEDSNENRMRDLVNEAAHRNGYDSDADFRISHRAPSYDEEGMDKSMVDIANNKEQIRESLNEQLRMNRDEAKDESAASINKALTAIDNGKKATVTIYRAVPKSLKEGKVRNGDWVTLSETYANIHGEHALHGDYRIMKEEVPAENLYWDSNDINEWGYDDRNDYLHKDAKNNRKLNDLITRDDKGDVIPPSQRFNSQKPDPRFRETNDVAEPALKWNSTNEELNNEESDGYEGDEKLTVNNVNQKIYDISGPHLSKLYKNGSLGRVLVGDHADINQIKAYREYNSVRENLAPLRRRLEGMIPHCTDAARKEVENTISDIDYALDYYKRLYEGEDVWRSAARPRFRILDEQSNTPAEEGGEVVAKVGELAESLHTPVRVARTISDVPDGVAKRAIEKGRNIKGWYDPNTGEVVVYLPNTDSVADAQATILHEVVAHKGLKEMLGKESFDELCGKVFDALPEDVRNGLLEKHGDRLIAGDEYMASIAESDIEPSLWEKIKSFVRDAFRKIGVDLSVSDNDVRYLLWKSKNRLMSRDNGMDLVNKVAADAEVKQKFGVGEYKPAQESSSLDKETVERTLERFDNQVKNHPAIHSLYSEEDIEGLSAYGVNEEVIAELMEALKNESIIATYLSSSNRIVMFPSHVLDEDTLESFMWHENVHYILHNSDIKDIDKLMDACIEYVKEKKPMIYKHITENYDTDVWKEESVAYLVQDMFNQHGADKLLKGTFAGDSGVANLFNQLFNEIKNERTGEHNQFRRGGGTLHGETTESNEKDSSLRERLEKDTGKIKKEGEPSDRNSDIGREISHGEEGVRFREEESDGVSDGTREAYEKAINTKGSVGKAHLSAYNFQEAFQDETLSVKILQKIIEEHSGEKLKGFENAYLAENRLGSTNLQQRNKFIEELYEPMMKIVDSLVKKGVSEKEIKNYLIAKSGLERNREFAVRDAIASAEKDDDKEATQKLRKQYEDNRNILRRQHAEGKLGWDEYQDKLDELAALYTNKFVDYSGLTAITGDETHFTDIAKDIVKDFETKQNTDALWNSVNAATKFALKKSYDSGITSKEAYNHVSNMFEYYIPMRGWSEETAEDVYDYINQDRGTFSATIKKAEGHLHESYDPFAIIGNMAESAILQGNRNLMKQKFMNMVINHPSDVAKLSRVWFKQSGDKWEASFPDIAKDATADEVAQAIEAHEKEMLDLEKDGKAECRSNKLDINYHITPKNISQHAVVVKRGGKDYVVYINGNPRAAEALNGKLKMGEQDIAWSFYDYLKRMYAAGMTSYNINFVGANVSRDIQHAFFITYIDKGIGAAVKLAKNGPRALKTVSRGVSGKLDLSRKEDVHYNEFLENGGETGYSNLNSIEEWKADNDKRLARLKGLVKGTGYAKAGLNHLKDWFEFANRIAENSTRFNAYMLARESGKGVGEAINEAKNITVNFNKKGSSQTPGLFGVAANIFRRWVLFANPIIQGMYQVYNISKQHKARAASAFAFHTAMGIAVPMLNTFLVGMYGDDDDEYFNQNDFTRRNNLMLYIPRAGYLKIPLAPIFRNMYAMGDILYMKMNGLSTTEDMFFDSVKEARAMFSLEGQSGQKEWSPARFLLPDLVGPILDVAENENFSGAPIYKSTEFNKLDPEFKKIYKDAWAPLVELSRVMNTVAGGNDYRKSDIGKWANPAAMQHLITNYTGGVGQLIGDVSSAFSDVITGDFVENFDMMKVPVAKRFFTIPNERTSGTAIRREYFKIKDEMDALNHEVKERAKNAGGDLKLLDELSELQNSKEYDMLLDFKKSSKGITKEESPEKKVERMKAVNEWYNEQTKKK